jgi:acyl-CoA thioester hydrolase
MSSQPPPPAAADPSDLTGPFSHESVIEVRFADTDAMRHVNNAKYLTYCESARLRYWTDVTGEGFSEGNDGAESLILAEARITYRAQTQFGETVVVQSRATRIGTSSFTLQHRLTAGFPGGPRRLVAVSESVLVRYDYAAERPVPLTSELIAALEAHEGRSLRVISTGD